MNLCWPHYYLYSIAQCTYARVVILTISTSNMYIAQYIYVSLD